MIPINFYQTIRKNDAQKKYLQINTLKLQLQ